MKIIHLTCCFLLLFFYGIDPLFSTTVYVPCVNKISVIDTTTNLEIGIISLDMSSFTDGIVILPSGDTAYVTDKGTSTVAVIDLITQSVTSSISVGTQPSYIVISPDGTRIYTANNGSNDVSVIDPSTNMVIATVSVGMGPQFLAITPDGSQLYVNNVGSSGVDVINTATNMVTTTISTNNEPFSTTISGDGSTAYIMDLVSNDVIVVDTTTNMITTTIAVGTFPIYSVETPNGLELYVTNLSSNNVSVIDTTSNTVTNTIAVGGNPRNITITPDGSQVYVSNSGDNTVSVIDTSSKTVIATPSVGPTPNQIAVPGGGFQVYVLNLNGSSISAIDTATNMVVATISTPNSPQFMAWTDKPLISEVSPNNGPTSGGTSITITGTNLNGATAVNFGATPATSFTPISSTQVTAVSPAGTGTVDVTVTTPKGTSPTSTSDQFTYTILPTITDVSPNFGPEAGGTNITITGNNFDNASSVNFDLTPATSYIVNSSSSISAVSPFGTGTVDVTVTTPAGTSAVVIADEFTYYPIPTVGSFSPNFGSTDGGTLVTVYGTNFYGVTAVNFGVNLGTSIDVTSPTSLNVVSPPGTGVVGITVTTPGGTSIVYFENEFFYYAPPTVTNVNPISGPDEGGTNVTVTGTNFTTAYGVYFGSTFGSGINIISDTTLSIVSPPGTGTVDVTVINPGGTSPIVMADEFTYIPIPSVTNVNPNSGPLSGGTNVTITGTNFENIISVLFGSSSATSYVLNSTTSITAMSPTGLGTVDVTVTTNLGTSAITSNDEFTYTSGFPPTVMNINPNSGPISGGTSVNINGSNFNNVMSVDFGSTPAASYNVNTSSSITATSPSGTGTVDVTVTTSDGTSPTNSNDQFTYTSGTPPSVTNVAPNFGPTSGGTNVIISGDNFFNVMAVHFGSTPVSTGMVNSPTMITVFSPPGSGTVDVTVISSNGTSATNPNDLFTYTSSSSPSVTSVNPNAGTTSGGTSVTINGSNFNNVMSVYFGLTPATSFMVSSSSMIIATSPSGSGTVDITVITSDGTSPTNQNDQFTYVSPTLPPSNFTGVIEKNTFLDQYNFYLNCQWNASPSTDVVLYRLYSSGLLVGEISAQSPLTFFTHVNSKLAATKFTITAVSSLNVESIPIKIKIL